ncbi:MAG TPA: hypothetical protein H9775_15130 [Candidatus Blautia merdipullorum]|nr:hypothetical protein [Candidatus Blautia merdipullorum]
MKFEQAFYTWGENQLSRYKKGLGVCASSCLQNSFLDKCLGLGGLFNTEHTERTTEFILYSQDFQTFVGVGISPAQAGSDGRMNKLCHFFIPAQTEGIREPEEYFLEYPFQRETEPGELPQAELEKARYDYRGLLKKYHFDREKLAELLWKSFPCICGEQNQLVFIIDRKKYSEEAYGQIAREVCWLLSMLAPVVWGERDSCRKNISCGVYTVDNAQAVRFLFTDKEEEGKDTFSLCGGSGAEEEIPDIYITLADRALQGKESLQAFYQEIYDCRYTKTIQTRMLSMLYLRRKLNQGETVSVEEMEKEWNVLLVQCSRSRWHRKLLRDYLRQGAELDNHRLVQIYRRLVSPQFDQVGGYGPEEKEELIQDVVFLGESLYGVNRHNYQILIKAIPRQIRKEALGSFYERGKTGIRKDMEKIRSAEELEDYLEAYRELKEEETFCWDLLEKGEQLYEPAELSERSRITVAMENLDKEAWQKYLRGRLERLADWQDYRKYLEENRGRIESSQQAMHLEKLLGCAEEVKEEEREEIRRAYDQLTQGGVEIKSRPFREKMNEVIRNWDIQAEIRQIKEEDLIQLAQRRRIETCPEECRKVWLECVCRFLRQYQTQRQYPEEDTYRGLLERLEELYRSPNCSQEALANYEKLLWDIAEGSPYRQILFVNKQEMTGNYIRKYSVWQNMDITQKEDFQNLQRDLEERGDEPEIKDFARNLREYADPAETVRNCCRIWLAVENRERITEDMTSILKGCQEEENGQLEGFQKIIRRKILEREFPRETDVADYFQILEWERSRSASLSGEKLGERFRNIYEEYGDFADQIRSPGGMGWLTRGSLREVCRKFFAVLDWNERLTRENVSLASKTTGCLTGGILEQAEEVVKLNKRCKVYMDKLQKANEEKLAAKKAECEKVYKEYQDLLDQKNADEELAREVHANLENKIYVKPEKKTVQNKLEKAPWAFSLQAETGEKEELPRIEDNDFIFAHRNIVNGKYAQILKSREDI